MPLVNGAQLLKKARQDQFAVGGFDVFGFESLQAIIAAAEERKTPVFLHACVRGLQHLGTRPTALLMKEAASRCKVPVVVHFDHGPEVTRLSEVVECLEAGFTSVMVDGSRLPIDQNIALTRQALVEARRFGACVEGEIGRIGRVIGGKADEVAEEMAHPGAGKLLTTLEDARRYVSETCVDYLAVSIGSVSGTSSRLNLPLLELLASEILVPLVLHGGTGVPEEDISRAVKLGIAKVNIAHGMRRCYINALREQLADGKNMDNPFAILGCARDAMRAYVKTKMTSFGGAGITL